jgi:hypothetical protein
VFETGSPNTLAELRGQANKIGSSKQCWLNELKLIRRAHCLTQIVMNGISHRLRRCVEPVRGIDSDISCEGLYSNFLR